MRKCIWFLLCVFAIILLLTACGGGQETAVKVYTVTEKFNSDTVNQWKTLYLLDEDNYVLTVDAVDSDDPSRETADFYMAGNYITNQDGTVTILPGYGYAKVLNGDVPMEFAIEPEENDTMGNMYLTMIGQFTTFKLNSDGTWEGIGK